MGDEDRVLSAAQAIIGADETQLAAKGRPIPPPPGLGPAARMFLWVVALFWVIAAISRFWHGAIGQGFGALVGGFASVVIRWAMLDGLNRSPLAEPAISKPSPSSGRPPTSRYLSRNTVAATLGSQHLLVQAL